MPIRPENRDRYPADWREISLRIRVERAGNLCECRGECGRDHATDDPADAWETWLTDGCAEPERGRCTAVNGHPNPRTGSRVILTVAHRDHTPEHCDDENLFAACQGCHLSYDREHHAETRAATLAAARQTAGQLVLGVSP